MSDETKYALGRSILRRIEDEVRTGDMTSDDRRRNMAGLVAAITEAYDLPIEPEFQSSDNEVFDALRHGMILLLDDIVGHLTNERGRLLEGTPLITRGSTEWKEAGRKSIKYNCIAETDYAKCIAERQASDEIHGFTPDELDAVPDKDVKKGIGDVFEHVLGRPIETKDEGRDVPMDAEALDDSTVEPMTDPITLHLPDSDPDIDPAIAADAYTIASSLGGRMAAIDERMNASESRIDELVIDMSLRNDTTRQDIKTIQGRLDHIARKAGR